MIVSMTHQPSDVLAMLWLSRLAALREGREEPAARLPVSPLFETISEYRRRSADAAVRLGIGQRYTDQMNSGFLDRALVLTDNEDMTLDLVWADLGYWGLSSGPPVMRHEQEGSAS